MPRRAPQQLSFRDHRLHSGWGGPREGAGRKPAPRPIVHHVRRPPVPRDCPSHVTVRVRSGLPSLRKRRFAAELERSLRATCERGEFRVVHYSIQSDHLHLLVESAGKQALGRGMKAVSARIARAVNRVCRSKGPVLAGRYHLRVLRAPREVRHALAYVLLNARRHGWKRTGTAPPPRIDEASSGRWFDGWRPGQGAPSREPPPVSRPHTWLLRLGWRRHGLIDPGEIPGAGAR